MQACRSAGSTGARPAIGSKSTTSDLQRTISSRRTFSCASISTVTFRLETRNFTSLHHRTISRPELNPLHSHYASRPEHTPSFRRACKSASCWRCVEEQAANYVKQQENSKGGERETHLVRRQEQ